LSFVCPSANHQITSNFVFKSATTMVMRDLTKVAKVKGGQGHSYEVSGCMNGVKKTEASVSSMVITRYAPRIGQRPGPSGIILMLDADDAGGTPPDLNDYPDSKDDNHGAAGANMAFCDGHAEWVTQKRFNDVLKFSNDSP
jgi:prepilin-type processing-associated H-X9-DG protein